MTWIVASTVGVVLAALVAVAGLLWARRSPRFRGLLGQNDVPGILFGALGVLYGALLAFVVFATWESYARAEDAVTDEGAALVSVYRDSQIFPDPLKGEIQTALRTYTNTVVATEWASHGNLVVHTTPDLLNPLWALYRQVPIVDDQGNTTQYAPVYERLHALELQRHLRHLSGEQTLPPIFWPVLVGGSVIVVLFSYVFHQDSLKLQAAMTGLLAGMLALVLTLIFSLNQPFTGPVPVSQQPLLHALAQFDALDLPPAAP